MAFEVSGITVIDGTRNITANTIIASGITYPTSDGTSGQVIITDGSGNLSFSSVSIDGSSYQTKADALAANTSLVALIDDRMQVSNVSTLVSTEVSALVDSAPSTLDTLNELAAALGDDPNFATTVTNSIATKLPLAGGTMTGTIAGFTSTGIDDNATSTAITIDASQNVTVGGTTAGNAGTVNVSVGSPGSTVGGVQLWAGTSGSHFMQFGDVASGDGYYRGAIGYLHSSDSLVAYSAGTEAMRIDSSGTVGIGVIPDSFNTVDGALQIGTRNTITSFSNDIGIGYNHYYSSGWKYANADVASRFSSTSSIPFLWQYAASGSADGAITWSEAMRIDSSGRVGIGTTSPASKLTVHGDGIALRLDGTGNTTRSILLRNVGGSAEGVLTTDGNMHLLQEDASKYMRFSTANTERMRIDSSGNVGIGTDSPDQTLHVHKGSAGSVSSHASSVLTLENSTTGILQFLTPNTNAQQIRFGDPQDNGAGIIQYDHSANVMQFNVNGPERMRIDSSGNVGIGTTSPSQLLNVAGNADVNGDFYVGSSTNIIYESGTTFNIRAAVADLTFQTNGANERMRIDSSGNVGIGTTSPAAKVHINGTGDLLRLTSTNGSAGGAQIDLMHFTASPADNDDHGIINFGGYHSGTTQTYGSAIRSMWTDVSARQAALKFFTRNGDTFGERMRIDSSGNVGIGTTSPSALLDLVGPSSTPLVLELNSANSNCDLTMQSASTSSVTRLRNGTNDFQVHTNGTERMRIDASGNLLVGATSASAKFQVTHNSAATPVALLQNTNGSSSGVGGVQTSLNSTANNTNCYHFKGTTQGVASYFLYGNGTSSFTSDERQKKNIVATRDGYLDDLKRLRVVDYHWNTQEDTEDKNVGLIAQEVEQVFPHLVIEHEMEGVGLRKNLRGSEFTFVLIKAIQEQQAMIDELKAEVAALKGE